MSKELKYKTICPICGKVFDGRNGKRIPDGKVVCRECFDTHNADNADKQPKVDEPKKKQYPEFVPKDWTECYKLPLHLDDYCVFAWDADGGMALSCFELKYDEKGNYLLGEPERIKHIIDVINGDCSSDFEPEWKLSDEPCAITYKGERQFLVRGWGHLTGCGGLNLPAELAAKMQDEFINYILDNLNGK